MSSADLICGLPVPLKEMLGVEDDPQLWREVLSAVAQDASLVTSAPLYAVVGCCSHWVRPHQSRWTAAGGFALPVGYGDGEGFLRGLPNLDWKVILQFDLPKLGWVTPHRTPAKRVDYVRLAIPSRTARHNQAAVHAIWSAGTSDSRQKRTAYYGFRKGESGWRLVAHYERGERQRQISTTPVKLSEQ